MSEKPYKKSSVGILAYGSLISNPGKEINNEKVLKRIIYGVMTPFHVEFARSSSERGGAPTLVPVTSGGAHVQGRVFEMDLPQKEVMNVLYRREINKVGKNCTYKHKSRETATKNTVMIECLTNFAGLDTVFYTKIAANIKQPTAEYLACLAIESVAKADGRDGITYLINAIKEDIVTPLSQEYKNEILRKRKCKTLEEALAEILVEKGADQP